jgi:hypothetical protein
VNWQPIETCPQDGYFLVHQDGAIRTMMRFDGQWELPDIPILIDKVGNRLVAREVQEYRGETLEITCCVYEPTEWMEIPDAPDAP